MIPCAVGPTCPVGVHIVIGVEGLVRVLVALRIIVFGADDIAQPLPVVQAEPFVPRVHLED